VLLREPKAPQQIIQNTIDFPSLRAALPEELLPIFSF
jgi:hypothetical protein